MSAAAEAIVPTCQDLLLTVRQGLTGLLLDEVMQLARAASEIADTAISEAENRLRVAS